mgnify:CR=1
MKQTNHHAHEPDHRPYNGTGYEVCACGATRRVENGKPASEWHTCKLCIDNEQT